MPSKYQKISQEDSEDVPSSDTQSSGFVISKKIFWCFLTFTLLNAGLAAANIHYSLRVTESLRKYRQEDLSSLRRIDPFSGSYVPSSSGRQAFYNE